MYEFKAKWRQCKKSARLRLRALYSRAREQYGSFSSARALFTRIPLAMALIISASLILSTGPQIQHYVLSLIYSDAPSIYGSAYQDGMAEFPEIQQWIMTGLQWPFPIIATVVVGFSIRHMTARQLFISSTVTCFLTLAAYDLMSGVLRNALSAGYILENIVANIVGGVLFAFTFVAIVTAANLCFVHLQGPRMWRQFVVGSATVIGCICVNAATFYVAEFFYRPIPVRIDAVFDYPVSGAIATDAHDAGDNGNTLQANFEEEKRRQPFKFFPKNLDGAAIHWKSSVDENEFLAEWGSLSKSWLFDATIEFYADCLNGKFDTPPSEGNVIRINNINNFSVSLDKGWSQFSTVHPPRMSGRLDTEFGSHLLFQLDSDADAKQIEITQFVDKTAAMTIANEGRQLSFFVNAPLAAWVEEGIARAGRTLSFKINGKNYSVDSEKPEVGPEDHKFVCRPLSPNGAIEQQDRVTIVGARYYFGTVVRISRRPLPNSIYGIRDNELKVLGGNGRVTLTRPNKETLLYGNSGTLRLLAFSGNVASLDVDRLPMSTRPIDHYQALGELNGDFESPAKVRFVGLAKALWKNGARVNPTKWERLSWGERLYVLGMIMTILGPIVGYVAIQIKNDANIEWLSSLRMN